MHLENQHLLAGRPSRWRLHTYYLASDIRRLLDLIAAQTRTAAAIVCRGWLESFESQCDLPGHEPAATEFFRAVAAELPHVPREGFSVRLRESTAQALHRWAGRFGCSASVLLNVLMLEAIRQWAMARENPELQERLEQTPLAKAA